VAAPLKLLEQPYKYVKQFLDFKYMKKKDIKKDSDADKLLECIGIIEKTYNEIEEHKEKIKQLQARWEFYFGIMSRILLQEKPSFEPFPSTLKHDFKVGYNLIYLDGETFAFELTELGGIVKFKRVNAVLFGEKEVGDA
jgi:hypothetical protein